MNIGIISSREYLQMAKLMLKSLLHACSEQIVLYLFHLDLTDDEISIIDIDRFKMVIHPMIIDPLGFEGIQVNGHFGLYSYFRLLAPYILPENIDRIMWLDTDLIIMKDLTSYYYTPFEENVLIASPSVMNQLGKGLSETMKKKYSVGDNAVYFNAGVLILNLSKFREKCTLERILRIAHEDQNELHYIDQDVLNCLFWNDCLITNQYLFNFSPKDAYYDKKINKDSLKNAYLIHYCGEKKPTDFTYPDLGFNEYWKYAKDGNIHYYYIWILHKIYCMMRNLKHIFTKVEGY